MKTSTKIRWLLLIVTIGLFATALTARWAAIRLVNLDDIAVKISSQLAQKETFIYSYLTDTKKFKQLQSLDKNPEVALETISFFADKNIFFQNFRNDTLVFWSDTKISGRYAQNLKDGTSFITYRNGWYEVIKKSEGLFSTVFFIPVKANYPYNNQYLNSSSGTDIIKDNTISIASFSDKNVSDIKNSEGRYLFSIKRTSSVTNIPYTTMEIFLWVIGFFILALLVNSICIYFADKGYPGQAAAGLLLIFILIRYLGLNYHFPEALYQLEVFSPKIYASSFYFPSLADFGLNIIVALWFIIFLYSYKSQIFKTINNKWLGYPILAYIILVIAFLSYTLSDIFFGLVFNSNINFKVTNLINLDIWSILGIIFLLMTLFTYYLVLEMLIIYSSYINIKLRTKLFILIGVFVLFNIYKLVFVEFTVFSSLIFLLIFSIGKIVYQYGGRMVLPALVLICLIFATIVSIKLNRFENIKEREIRKRLALKLESADDPNALLLFNEIEEKISNDRFLKLYFKRPQLNTQTLNKRFQQYYLSGYLSEFDFKIHPFDKNNLPINFSSNQNINEYKRLVEYGSIKVSDNFYRVNNTFGVQSYFAIIPIRENGNVLGTFIVELKSKDLSEFGTFPQLLKDGKLISLTDYIDYSYAFYNNGKLVHQTGNYIYDLVNKDFKGRLKDFIIIRKNNYSHMVYQVSPSKAIIVTKEYNTFWREIASLSFFFIVFLIFGIITISYKWIWEIFTSYKFSFKNFKVRFLVSNNKILYKTRIQIALVLAVVTSLLIIGLITFSYITIQYKEQQEDLIKSKIRIIANAFEDNVTINGDSINYQENAATFYNFSRMYNSDLNLFDIKGKLLYSTQSKMYSIGLLASRMDAEAFINVNLMQKSEYIQEESIGELKFTSAYMPVKNSFNDVVAYLQLPYFANQNEFNQKIGNFLNLLINIYVLVFVAIGFFAFVVANQITSPLTLIQESMSKTVIGRKNKPISWKRNDEIGNLIKEYNKMIEALEDSASKLAQSERETAWREMAKQVAHEIKNPLTPLRLGIQMLDRSWKEKDPKFDIKFEKFSKSSLEQIDSLSHIASEFSNFAKMPDVKLENIVLGEVLNQAIQIFEQIEHIHIECDEACFNVLKVRADRDQLLRSFNNLLKNAVEAMPEDKSGLINISCNAYQSKVEIKIADNGSGISDELREKIFTPNFTTKSSGTGLGLAFVKQAIENIGGNIYFTTEINVGTTFYIILPLVT